MVMKSSLRPSRGGLLVPVLMLMLGVLIFAPSGAAPARAQSGDLPYATGNHPLVLVDKQHRLSPYYYPRDLNYLSSWGVPTQGSQLLRRDAARNLSYMLRNARADGAYMSVTSSYRSYWVGAVQTLLLLEQRLRPRSRRDKRPAGNRPTPAGHCGGLHQRYRGLRS